MEINILHLYYDILNLYGEYGNIQVLEKHLKLQGATVNIDKKTIKDEIDFENYNFIYLGSGTEKNLLIVNEDIKRYTDILKEKIEKGMTILATGNSHLLFGKYILMPEKVQTLGIFDYYCDYNKTRIQTDVIATTNFLENPIVGFINSQGVIKTELDYLLDIKFSQINIQNDGFRHNNFFGTSVLGPILAHNPEFLQYIIKCICTSRVEEFEYINNNNQNEIDTYNNILRELSLRSQK